MALLDEVNRQVALRDNMRCEEGRSAVEPSAEDMIRELWNKKKIHEVVTRYCRAVDRMDKDLLLSCYHPDGIDDHGFVVADREEFWTTVSAYHTQAQANHQHVITNHSCELDGDVAHCETYWFFAGMDHDGRSVPMAGGRYVDRMEKRGGEWRIAARKCVPDWTQTSGGEPLSPQRKALAEAGTVARDRTDCSYERPLTIPVERIGLNLMRR